jgi:hypothetical protein
MNEMKLNPFYDGMRIFLDYIDRTSKKDPDYKPHSIIRAFSLALEALEKAEDGKNVLGVAMDGDDQYVLNPYSVVLMKNGDQIEVVDIINMTEKKSLPPDVMLIVFRLQIKLDKIPGETVSPQQMVDSLNSVINGEWFACIGDHWREAITEFRRTVAEGKMQFPGLDKIVKQLNSIGSDTPWESYPSNLRVIISSSYGTKLKDGSGVIIASPKDSEIVKAKVFDQAIDFLMGKGSEYFSGRVNPFVS